MAQASAAYLPFHPHPSIPRLMLPDGACDAHCHVFGPAARFPFASERTYTPVDAPKETLAALHAKLGLTRAVVVQASCHGTDNAAMLDAIAASDGRWRGVAMVAAACDARALEDFHWRGVRGLRFNFVRHLGTDAAADAIRRLAPMIAEMGWHVVIHCDAERLGDIASHLAALPVPVVIDHMARVDASLGFDQPAYRLLLELMRDEKFWVKVCGSDRITRLGPPYADAVPFAHDLVSRFPDRVLWGTDWPHPNARPPMPDDGALVGLLAAIAPSETPRRKLLVDNPARLYWNDWLT